MGKAIFILQRALPLENLVVNGKLSKGTKAKTKGQRRPWPPMHACNYWPGLKGLGTFCRTKNTVSTDLHLTYTV